MIKVVYYYEGELSNLQLIKWLSSIIKIFCAGFGFCVRLGGDENLKLFYYLIYFCHYL